MLENLTSALQYLYHGISPGDPCPIHPDSESDDEIVEHIKKKWPMILHRDLKLDNIPLCESKGIKSKVWKPLGFPFCFFNSTTVETRQRNPNIVLADFGVACHARLEEQGLGNCWRSQMDAPRTARLDRARRDLVCRYYHTLCVRRRTIKVLRIRYPLALHKLVLAYILANAASTLLGAIGGVHRCSVDKIYY